MGAHEAREYDRFALADDGFAQRDRNGLRARTSAELQHRPLCVGAHRVRREEERLADLRIRPAFGKQTQHFAFALRERLPVVTTAGGKRRGKDRVDIETAGSDRIERAAKIVEGSIFEREATGAGVERIGNRPRSETPE